MTSDRRCRQDLDKRGGTVGKADSDEGESNIDVGIALIGENIVGVEEKAVEEKKG